MQPLPLVKSEILAGTVGVITGEPSVHHSIHPAASPTPSHAPSHPSSHPRWPLTPGAGSGIGAAAVRCFAAAGAKVIYASDIVDKNLQAVADGVVQEGYKATVVGVKTDVTKADEVEALVRKVIKEHGRLDWFVRLRSFTVLHLVACLLDPSASLSWERSDLTYPPAIPPSHPPMPPLPR